MSGRNLLLFEAVLLVGLAREAVEGLVLSHPRIPGPLRVVIGMVVVISAFGGLIAIFRKHLVETLKSTHDAVQRLPLPTPQLLVHAGLIFAIFLLYAWLWDDQTDALSTLWRTAEHQLALLRVWLQDRFAG